MAYFPFFMDIGGKRGLIVGGGNVAARKVEKLLPFGPELTVIAPHVSEEITAHGNVHIVGREYIGGDEENFLFVVAATSDRAINRKISMRCRDRGIPVNVVDDPELCTFIFPSLVQEGKLTIGISTSGSSPTAAIELKRRIRDMIPPSFDSILDYLQDEREKIRKDTESESERHVILRELFMEAMEKGRPLSEEESIETRRRHE